MEASSPVTHVLFDLDGLLISTEEIYTTVFTKFLAAYGKRYTYEAECKTMGRSSEDVAKILISEYGLTVSPTEFVESLHKNFPPEIWDQADLLPGAGELIDYFHFHSIPMAIATSSKKTELEHKLSKHKEVWAKIHHIVVADGNPEVAHGKPAPDIFQLALRLFNDPSTSPSTTLVFEDAWNGVIAALAAGMRVVWVPDSREAAGFPDPNLSEEEKSRISRISSLKDFLPFKLLASSDKSNNSI